MDTYYGTVTTKPDDAAWRLDLMKKVMVPDMKADHIYPKVFFSIDELDRISAIEADLFAYVLENVRNGLPMAALKKNGLSI